MKLSTLTLIIFGVFFYNLAISQSVQFEYVKPFVGDDQAQITCMKTDDQNYIYVAGSFQGTVDFDPGAGTSNLTSAGQYDAFFGKYSPDGALIWIQKFGAAATESVADMQLDSNGYMYLTGGYHFTVDFDPGAGNSSHTATALYDMYVSKYDTSGVFVWANAFGGNGTDQGRSLTLDADNNVYVTGSFSGSIWVGSDYLDFSGSSSTADLFICRLDSSGNFTWAKGMGSSSNEAGQRILLNASNELIVSGYFQSTVDFDPSAEYNGLTSTSSSRDIFIAAYDTLGNFISVQQLEGSTDNMVYDMMLRSDESMILVGDFSGSIDVNPGTELHTISGGGSFVLCLDNNLEFLWAADIQGPVAAQAVTVEDNDNIYIGGHYYDGSIQINSTTVSSEAGNEGYYDSFISKLDNAGGLLYLKTINSPSTTKILCSTADQDNNYIIGGSFTTGPTDFDPGSGVTELTATITDPFFSKYNECMPTTNTVTLSGCDSVVFDDEAIFESGTYLRILENSSGCDSLLTIIVEINIPSNSSIAVTECNQYISPSGKVWLTSGIYIDSILNTAGCDSIIEIDLTINTVDTIISYAFPTLTAVSGADSYQWLDCNNEYALVTDEISESFTPEEDGNYAVEISQNGCVDTSYCYLVSGIGITENDFGENFNAYPIPMKDELFISLGDIYNEISVKVYNTLGVLVQDEFFIQKGELKISLNEEPGFYIVEIITSDNKKALLKVLKE